MKYNDFFNQLEIYLGLGRRDRKERKLCNVGVRAVLAETFKR